MPAIIKLVNKNNDGYNYFDINNGYIYIINVKNL